jgi:hypothetical protein
VCNQADARPECRISRWSSVICRLRRTWDGAGRRFSTWNHAFGDPTGPSVPRHTRYLGEQHQPRGAPVGHSGYAAAHLCTRKTEGGCSPARRDRRAPRARPRTRRHRRSAVRKALGCETVMPPVADGFSGRSERPVVDGLLRCRPEFRALGGGLRLTHQARDLMNGGLLSPWICLAVGLGSVSGRPSVGRW